MLPPEALSLARQPPRDADIAPALTDMLRLLGQTPSPDAASDAAQLVSDILSDTADGGLPGAASTARVCQTQSLCLTIRAVSHSTAESAVVLGV